MLPLPSPSLETGASAAAPPSLCDEHAAIANNIRKHFTNPPYTRRVATFTAISHGRLVDVTKQHLAVVPIDVIGPLIANGRVQLAGRTGKIDDEVRPGDELATDATGLVPEDHAQSLIQI